MKPSETLEGRLADEIEATVEEGIGGCIIQLSVDQRTAVIKALRERARWMSSDIKSGERTTKRKRY